MTLLESGNYQPANILCQVSYLLLYDSAPQIYQMLPQNLSLQKDYIVSYVDILQMLFQSDF